MYFVTSENTYIFAFRYKLKVSEKLIK